MSEIHNSMGANAAETSQGGHDQQTTAPPQGIAFQGEKTDLRKDPMASVNKAFIIKMKKVNIDGNNISFGTKDINQAKERLQEFYNNPAAAQKAMALYPAFQGYARKKGYENPDAYALALEHYAATKEFVTDTV